MKVTFLGTGTSQGIPVIACNCDVCRSLDFRDKRLRTSIHLAVEGKSFIIDTGPDFRQQVLRERIESLDAVIYTHEHKDHTAGMDDVRGFNFKQKRDMPIYARRQVLDQLKQEFAYAFAEKKYPGVPMLETHVIDGSPFEVEGVTFTPIDVLHYKLPVYGFRVGDFTYITDCNHIPEAEKEKIKGSKVLVVNALQKEEHISHYNLEQAIAQIDELGVPENYLIHMSHRLGKHQDIARELPAHVQLSYDGLQLEL